MEGVDYCGEHSRGKREGPRCRRGGGHYWTRMGKKFIQEEDLPLLRLCKLEWTQLRVLIIKLRLDLDIRGLKIASRTNLLIGTPICRSLLSSDSIRDHNQHILDWAQNERAEIRLALTTTGEWVHRAEQSPNYAHPSCWPLFLYFFHLFNSPVRGAIHGAIFSQKYKHSKQSWD